MIDRLREYKTQIIMALLFILTIVASVLTTSIIKDLEIRGKVNRLESEIVDSNNTIEDLKEKLEKAQLVDIDTLTLENETLKARLEEISKGNTDNKGEDKGKDKDSVNITNTNQVIYMTYSKLDDDRTSNLINAVLKLNGSVINGNAPFSLNGAVGPYTYNNGYVFTTYNNEYSSGTEELVHAIYTCALSTGFKIKEYSLNNNGMAYVTNSKDLVIENTTNVKYKIHCKYSSGFIEVYFEQI